MEASTFSIANTHMSSIDDRLKSRAAEAIHSQGRHRDGDATAQRDMAGNVGCIHRWAAQNISNNNRVHKFRAKISWLQGCFGGHFLQVNASLSSQFTPESAKWCSFCSDDENSAS